MKPILNIVFLFIICKYTKAQSGTLDSSFGTNGKVVDQRVTGHSSASVLQTDGKIIVTGSNFNEPGGFITKRYNTDGSNDLSFSDNGVIITQINGSPRAIALQNDGKILITGTENSSGFDIVTVRYNSDGSIDNTFGINGYLISDFTAQDNVADMTTQTDDKIIIIGRTDNVENDPVTMVIARYMPDGSPDQSFGNGGSELFTYSHESLNIDCIKLQGDGKILIGMSNLNNSFFVERFFANGQRDLAFGINGRASCKIDGIFYSLVNDLAVTNDDKIVAAGETQ